jgi:hypothetical protein
MILVWFKKFILHEADQVSIRIAAESNKTAGLQNCKTAKLQNLH